MKIMERVTSHQLAGATLGIAACLGCLSCGADNSEDLGREQLAITNISTTAGFLGMSATGSYALTADIDMHGGSLQYGSTFKGTFDGGGHTISNVTQNVGGGSAGLFKTLQGATVKNVKLSNFHLQGQMSGGLAADCQDSVIQSVAVQNTGTAINGSNLAGGVCGQMTGGSISSSSATGSVTSLSGAAGGFVGWSSVGSTGAAPTLSSCSVAQLSVSAAGAGGGIMGFCQDAIFSRMSAEATVNGAGPVGGICGAMNGGSIISSYAKGSVTSTNGQAGGIAGQARLGVATSAGAKITISYAQSTVTGAYEAGGIVGYGHGAYVEDVYAVGNVTGSGAVGGLVGMEDGEIAAAYWTLNRAIYRGDVRDRTLSGWSGVVGGYYEDTLSRWTGTFFDKQLDPSGTYAVHGASQKPQLTSELTAATTASGGVYCNNIPPSTRCTDNPYTDPPWNAGTSSQHHTLRNMPGPNAQPQ